MLADLSDFSFNSFGVFFGDPSPPSSCNKHDEWMDDLGLMDRRMTFIQIMTMAG